MLKKLIYLILICMLPFIGMGDVLRWLISGSENVYDGETQEYISDVFSFLVPDEDIGVRLAAYDRDGNFVSYLHPVYGNPSGAFDPASIDYKFDDEWIGTRDDISTGPRQAMYDGVDPYERLFQMQIGNYDGDFNFNPILFSNGILVEGRYRYEPGDLGPYGGEWTVLDFYTMNPVGVPEPSTGFLFLAGAALLCLKRKTI